MPQLLNGRRKVQGDLLSVDLTGVKKTEPSTFQQCPIVEKEAKKTDIFYLNGKKTPFTERAIGRSCPERLWRLQP